MGYQALHALVDTTAYGVDGWHWCEVVEILKGTAAVYPIKVQIPDRGIGQYKEPEILDWQRRWVD